MASEPEFEQAYRGKLSLLLLAILLSINVVKLELGLWS